MVFSYFRVQKPQAMRLWRWLDGLIGVGFVEDNARCQAKVRCGQRPALAGMDLFGALQKQGEINVEIRSCQPSRSMEPKS